MKQVILGALLGASIPAVYVTVTKDNPDRLNHIEQQLAQIQKYTDMQIAEAERRKAVIDQAHAQHEADLKALQNWKPKRFDAGSFLGGDK